MLALFDLILFLLKFSIKSTYFIWLKKSNHCFDCFCPKACFDLISLFFTSHFGHCLYFHFPNWDIEIHVDKEGPDFPSSSLYDFSEPNIAPLRPTELGTEMTRAKNTRRTLRGGAPTEPTGWEADKTRSPEERQTGPNINWIRWQRPDARLALQCQMDIQGSPEVSLLFQETYIAFLRRRRENIWKNIWLFPLCLRSISRETETYYVNINFPIFCATEMYSAIFWQIEQAKLPPAS